MNSFHFTLGSSRVPRVRWFTGLQCGNPWFIATNTPPRHYAIPGYHGYVCVGPVCPERRTFYPLSLLFTVPDRSFLLPFPLLAISRTWTCLRMWSKWEEREREKGGWRLSWPRCRGIYRVSCNQCYNLNVIPRINIKWRIFFSFESFEVNKNWIFFKYT